MPEKLTPEQERLVRLRERQLSVRDPLEKQRTFQRSSAERERRRDSGLSLPEMWNTISQVWRAAIFGLVGGLLVIFLVTRYWVSPYAMPVAILGGISVFIICIIIGNALDLRDNIKKHM